MHILILSWRDTKNPLSGGAESFLHELSKRLVAEGHNVTLFTSSFPGANKEEVVDGVKILRRGTAWTVHLQAYQWYRSEPSSYDLVIDNFHALPFFSPLFAGTPVVGVIHEVTREIWFVESFFPVNVFGYLLEPLFFLPYRNSHFLVASPSTKKDLVKLGHPRDRVTVFFQGIDRLPLTRLPRKADHPLLLCLSRISPTKRFEHAIIALSIVKQEVPEATLTIAGSGKPEYLMKLKRLVADLSLEGSVTFQGFVSGKAKQELLKKAWLVLGTSIREGWGLAITEAAACGTPAVTYDVPGFRDSVRDGRTGIRVRPATPERLAQEVIRLIRDPLRLRRLARQAMRFTRGRTREATARQLIPLFERLAHQKRRPVSKRGKNILIFSWRDIKSPASGGAEVLTHEIAKRLVRMGNRVTVVAPIFPGAANIESVDGVMILRPSFFFATRPMTYLNWPRFLVNAAATYRSQLMDRTDLVIDQVHGLPSFTPLFARKPIILFPLEVANEIWLIEIPFPGNILGWLIERVYLFLFRNFPFLTISTSTATDLRRFGVRTIATITPGVNQPPGNLPAKSKKPQFIALGRITRMKRLEHSLLAFAQFRRTAPDSLLQIVGRGSYLKNVKHLTHKLGISRWVRFHGYVPEPEKYALLSKSWALISTSIREGWGLNVIEAASVGTPTIAYHVPGIVDAVIDGKTGLLTNTNTPEALSVALENFAQNASLRLELGRNARNHARKFSWDKTAEQFLAAVTNTLNAKP